MRFDVGAGLAYWLQFMVVILVIAETAVAVGRISVAPSAVNIRHGHPPIFFAVNHPNGGRCPPYGFGLYFLRRSSCAVSYAMQLG